MAQVAAAEQPYKRVGSGDNAYDLFSCIGQGSFASVYPLSWFQHRISLLLGPRNRDDA